MCTHLQIGCCIGSEVSVAQCNVLNCTMIEVNTSRAEALQCYRSRLHDNSTLNKCHGQLLTTLSLVTSLCHSISLSYDQVAYLICLG